MKRIIQKSTVSLLGAILLSGSLCAKEEITTITVHHFLSSKAPTHTKLLAPWAKKVEELSKGKLKIEIFPSMTMGGKPNELYKQVRNGTADIIWTVAGYTPGVFPRTEVYELPTVHRGSSLATNIAIKDNFDLIKADFKSSIKPLLIHTHAGNAIHMVNKKVTKISDLKGMKLRTPSRVGAWHIEELGAEPVGMSMPSFPQALSKNAVDGGLIPFEVFPPFKFHQLTQYSIEGHKGDRFGTSVFLLLMNSDKFNSLSKPLQKIIEDSFDMNMVKQAGQIWMDVEKPGMKMQAASKNSFVSQLDESSMIEFNAASQRVVNRWIKEVSTKGINGKELVRKAREAIRKNTK